ncbi:uncharacterized protein EAE97_009615 [Botrytis byssoidea]|uniref:Uncharacterized protein n=1 Tax=Botrytis byssoidea TaxID=139641 RepID=A0A9P5I252_9HELO|nr:uncharacterized protein EAE97_009615 [Botrytis byssoidea]KAF7930018.1 hypothetical protein EAE97_009615 [Botrytis byssoidea]
MSPLYTPPNYPSSRNSHSNSFNSSTSLSPVPLSGLNNLSSPLNRFEMQGLQRFASGSRSGSVSSVRSEHGRNRITQTSRNSSVSRHNFLKSQAMDVAHDSPSRYVSSGGSGRSRPLTSWARIGMIAIKMIGGACWRCRILGKKRILAILAQNETKLAKQLGRKLAVSEAHFPSKWSPSISVQNHIPTQCLLVSIFCVFNASVVGATAQTRTKADVQDVKELMQR